MSTYGSMFLDKCGLKTEGQTGKKRKYETKPVSKEEIDICLNCPRKKCSGMCKRITDYRRDRND